MKAIPLTQETFDATLASTDLPVLVDFWAEWCGPCQQLGPIVDQLASEQDGQALVAKVDVDAAPDLARRFNIRSIPTLLIFKNNEAVGLLRGVQSKSALADALAAA